MLHSTLRSLMGARVLRRVATSLPALALLVLPVVSLAQDEPGPVDTPGATGSVALERVNRYRERAGVPPMMAHPALVASAVGHVRYYDANVGDDALVGMGLHEERPEAPGFTGADMQDRAEAAGYSDGAVTENAGF